MLGVAVDIAHFAVAQMHADAAAARTHVAGRGFDFEFFVLRTRVVFHVCLLLHCQLREPRSISSAAPIMDGGKTYPCIV
jgi:hypothetical protein